MSQTYASPQSSLAAAVANNSNNLGAYPYPASPALKSPFPSFAHPSAGACLRVKELLESVHGPHKPSGHNVSVLDSLVRTILSQNTTDKNNRVAFATLKARYPNWRACLEDSDEHMEEAIRSGGLAKIKTANIKRILHALVADDKTGSAEPSLEWLRDRSDEAVKSYLSQFKGVGPKTIACLLMFNMQRPEFPVDTHVFEIHRTRPGNHATCTLMLAYLTN
jgi:endonuclease III